MTLFSTSVRLLYNVADFAWMSYRYWNGVVCPWSWLMHKWVKFKWLEKKKILSDCVRVLVKHLMKYPLLTHSFPMHPQKPWEFLIFSGVEKSSITNYWVGGATGQAIWLLYKKTSQQMFFFGFFPNFAKLSLRHSNSYFRKNY